MAGSSIALSLKVQQSPSKPAAVVRIYPFTLLPVMVGGDSADEILLLQHCDLFPHSGPCADTDSPSSHPPCVCCDVVYNLFTWKKACSPITWTQTFCLELHLEVPLLPEEVVSWVKVSALTSVPLCSFPCLQPYMDFHITVWLFSPCRVPQTSYSSLDRSTAEQQVVNLLFI